MIFSLFRIQNACMGVFFYYPPFWGGFALKTIPLLCLEPPEASDFF